MLCVTGFVPLGVSGPPAALFAVLMVVDGSIEDEEDVEAAVAKVD